MKMIVHQTLAGACCLSLSFVSFASADESYRAVITKDGKQIEGAIVGGTLTIKTAIQTHEVEAQRIHALSRTLLKDDEGHAVVGAMTIVSGEVRVSTEKGAVIIPAQNIELIKATDMFMAPGRSSSNMASGQVPQDLEHLILGRWQDSSNIAWEFFKDGTLVSGQFAGRYSFVGPHRIKIEFNSPLGMQVGPAFMLGMQTARVYEIVDLSAGQLVWDYQSARSTMTRIH